MLPSRAFLVASSAAGRTGALNDGRTARLFERAKGGDWPRFGRFQVIKEAAATRLVLAHTVKDVEDIESFARNALARPGGGDEAAGASSFLKLIPGDNEGNASPTQTS